MFLLGKKSKIVGTLVPLSALSSSKTPKSQGTFETGLYFLDWLNKTGQSAWQILPLHQTQLENGSTIKRVPSPYKGYGIGLDPKYLPRVVEETKGTNETKEIEKFVRENKDWIHDYALFCALATQFGIDDWRKWDKDLRTRKNEVITDWSRKLKKEIDAHIYTQWILHEEYKNLKLKAEKLDILLIGDLPFYVSIRSPLAWVYQDIFQLEKDGGMRYVSGIPDTYSAHFGRQVWGHPLYRWEMKHRSRMLDFWELRLRYLSLLFDSIRFDHAKGFFNYGKIDLKSKNKDTYINGPGHKVFENIMIYGKKCGMEIFAEDSGENLSALRMSLKKMKTPGIKIFRFALNEKKQKLNKEYADLISYPENTVVYTTTHDTESLILYLSLLSDSQKKQLASYARVAYSPKNHEFALKLRLSIIKSKAKTIIIPIQDWLLTQDRINIPGTEKEVGDSNWHYKLKVPIEELPTDLVSI